MKTYLTPADIIENYRISWGTLRKRIREGVLTPHAVARESNQRGKVLLFTGEEDLLRTLRPRGCQHCHTCGAGLQRGHYCTTCRVFRHYASHGDPERLANRNWSDQFDTPCTLPPPKRPHRKNPQVTTRSGELRQLIVGRK